MFKIDLYSDSSTDRAFISVFMLKPFFDAVKMKPMTAFKLRNF